jgi:hypothetical protein
VFIQLRSQFSFAWILIRDVLGRAPSWWVEEEDSTASKNVSTCTLCVTLHQCLCMQFILVIVHLLKEEWDQPICQEGFRRKVEYRRECILGHQSPLYLSSFYCLAEHQAMTFGFGHFRHLGFHFVWIKKRWPIYSSLWTYITLLQLLSRFLLLLFVWHCTMKKLSPLQSNQLKKLSICLYATSHNPTSSHRSVNASRIVANFLD